MSARSITDVTYRDSNPSSPARLRVEADADLPEVLLEIGDNPICLDAQQVAAIMRQWSGWLGDRAARA